MKLRLVLLFSHKIYQVDAHLGLAFAGLTADGSLITKFMHTEAFSHQFNFGQPRPTCNPHY